MLRDSRAGASGREREVCAGSNLSVRSLHTPPERKKFETFARRASAKSLIWRRSHSLTKMTVVQLRQRKGAKRGGKRDPHAEKECPDWVNWRCKQSGANSSPLARVFPEPRENTGKSSTSGPHISKLARANAWNPACLGLIPCRSEQGIFPGEQRNITESGSGRQVQIRGQNLNLRPSACEPAVHLVLADHRSRLRARTPKCELVSLNFVFEL